MPMFNVRVKGKWDDGTDRDEIIESIYTGHATDAKRTAVWSILDELVNGSELYGFEPELIESAAETFLARLGITVEEKEAA